MPRLISLARLLIVNLVLFAVLAEVAAVIHHYVDRHEFFYTRAGPPVATAADPGVTAFRIAPYFGFMRAPGASVRALVEPARLQRMAAPATAADWFDVRTNNYGFLSPHDYPYTPPGAQPLVIGVFGGSVAQWFALQGAPALTRALQADRAWRDRDIVVLDFAAGGYKQPQQLLVLNYLLAIGQRIDYAINIDGFNEIALAALNLEADIAAAMPSVQHVGPLARLAGSVGPAGQHDLAGRIGTLKRQAARIAEVQRTRTLAVVHLVDTLRLRALARRLDTLAREAAGAPAADSLLALAPAAPPAPTAGTIPARTMRLWSDSSRLMRDALHIRGTPFLEVVQPNQYFGARVFGPDEAKIARNPDSVYRRAVEAGYPLLVAAIPALRADGVDVLDATALFDAEPGLIYADDCCHYNQRGNDLLATAIAKAMLATGAAVPASESSGREIGK